MTRLFCKLAADRGRIVTPSTHLNDIMCYNRSHLVDLVQTSKGECRRREGRVDDENTSVVVLEANCFLLTVCCWQSSSSTLSNSRPISLLLAIMPHSEKPTNGHAINGSKPTRRGVYLLTHPRSASNLFQTMMAKQKSHGADVQSSSYHFFNAAFAAFMQMGRGSLQSSNWTEVDRAALFEPYKAAFEGLNKELADAEEQVS